MALCCYPFSIFPVTKQLHCFLKFYMIKIKSGFKVYSISPFKELPTDTCERYEWSFPFMKQELTKPSSLRAISMLAVFTFLFLSTEYFYVNRIAQNASSARTVMPTCRLCTTSTTMSLWMVCCKNSSYGSPFVLIHAASSAAYHRSGSLTRQKSVATPCLRSASRISFIMG